MSTGSYNGDEIARVCKYFEPSQSKLNELKLDKIIEEFNKFSFELRQINNSYIKMKNSSDEVSANEYTDCLSRLTLLEDNFLAYKNNMSETVKQAKDLLIGEYGPAEEEYW